jgi:hypothetical protein
VDADTALRIGTEGQSVVDERQACSRRGPPAIHRRDVRVVDVVEWRFDAQEAVGGDEAAVVGELDAVLRWTDSERQPGQRELGVDGVLEDRVHARSCAAVFISP